MKSKDSASKIVKDYQFLICKDPRTNKHAPVLYAPQHIYASRACVCALILIRKIFIGEKDMSFHCRDIRKENIDVCSNFDFLNILHFLQDLSKISLKFETIPRIFCI